MFEFTVSQSDGISILKLEGRIDSSTATQLSEALKGVIEGGSSKIVANLEGVEYMSSAGLREMVAALKQVQSKDKDGNIKLASPVDRVAEVLELSGLSSIFAVFETEQEAVDSF